MSELRSIADALATQPFAPAPSVVQLERRVVQRKRQRRLARVAAIVTCTVVALVLTRGVTNSTHKVKTIDGGKHSSTTVTATTAPFGAVPGAPSGGVGAGKTDSSNQVVPDGAIPLSSTTTTVVSDAQEGCTVESKDYQGVETPFGGAGFGTNSCEYVATVAGGYEAHGYWRVVIERVGATTVYDNGYYGSDPSRSSPPPPSPCGAVGTVQPGDHVVLYLRFGAESVADPTYVRAGPQFHC